MKFLSFLLVVSVVLTVACNDKSTVKSTVNQAPIMYEASELALIMRQMDGSLRKIRTSLLQGEMPTDSLSTYSSLHIAEATNPDELEASFYIMADAFINQVRTMHSATNHASYKAEFDKTIGACMNCHLSYCSGPLDRIKKLSISPIDFD